jgi:type IV pilus assembly protein PilC
VLKNHYGFPVSFKKHALLACGRQVLYSSKKNEKKLKIMAQINISKYNQPKSPLLSAKAKDTDSLMSFLTKDIKLFSSKLDDKKKERFYSELTVLFSSGINIKTALELIAEEETKEEDKELYQSILKVIVSGGGLSDALLKTNRFSPYEYYSIQIGEESGRLPDVLKELAKFFDGKIKQRRQVINAISNPIVVLASAFATLIFMLKFIVPMFIDMFKRFKSEIPKVTKMVIRASDLFSAFFPYLVLIIIAIIVIAVTQKQKNWYRLMVSTIVSKIPFVGDLVNRIYLARFCQSMNLLTSSRTPLIQALDLVKKMIGYYPIERSLDTVKEDVIKGVSLHESMSRFPVYNRRLIKLIKVAEEVNQLDVIFGKLAQQYNDEVEYKTALLSKLLEPLIIIFTGLIVGFILIAMYLPLFQLGTSMH